MLLILIPCRKSSTIICFLSIKKQIRDILVACYKTKVQGELEILMVTARCQFTFVQKVTSFVSTKLYHEETNSLTFYVKIHIEIKIYYFETMYPFVILLQDL